MGLGSTPILVYNVGVWLTVSRTNFNERRKRIMAKPTKCPRCKSANISCHLGWAECNNCDYEWSYAEQIAFLVRQVLKKLV